MARRWATRPWECLSSGPSWLYCPAVTAGGDPRAGRFRWWAKLAAGSSQGRLLLWEKRAWLLLAVLTLALRFFQLDVKPPHHDEAIHGHFAWELLHRQSYRYDPTYHGPLQYFVLAGLFALFGESDFVLRSYAAACGAALVLVPLLLRPLVGRGAALGMGWLLALSPSFLYFSRFARNDVPVALFTALAVALAWLQRKSQRSLLPWAGFFLALHAASKETIYVTGLLWLLSGLGLVLWVGPAKALAWWRGFWQRHRFQLTLALGVFALVCVVFYTVFFSWPQDMLFPLKAVRYWYEQHKIQRVGGPWTYHFPRLVLYEFLIFGLALAAVIRRRNRLRVPERFLVLWGAGALCMYAYLGEKVPWLAVHQLLPWMPLAGVEIAHILGASRRWLAKSLVAVGLVATLWSGLAVSFFYTTIEPHDPHAELLVFVQTTRAEQAVAREGLELYRRAPEKVFAAVEGEAAWPLSWQWKGLPVLWSLPAAEAAPPLVVADPGKLEPQKHVWGDGYVCQIIPLRAWWVERWRGVGVLDVGRWFLTRRAWSERGSTDIEVCRKRERS